MPTRGHTQSETHKANKRLAQAATDATEESRARRRAGQARRRRRDRARRFAGLLHEMVAETRLYQGWTEEHRKELFTYLAEQAVLSADREELFAFLYDLPQEDRERLVDEIVASRRRVREYLESD